MGSDELLGRLTCHNSLEKPVVDKHPLQGGWGGGRGGVRGKPLHATETKLDRVK